MLHFGLSSMDVCHLLLPQLSVAFVALSCAAAAMRLLHPYWNMQQRCPREPKLKKLKNLHCSIQCTQPLGILGQLMRLSFQVRCSRPTCPPQGICRDKRYQQYIALSPCLLCAVDQVPQEIFLQFSTMRPHEDATAGQTLQDKVRDRDGSHYFCMFVYFSSSCWDLLHT